MLLRIGVALLALGAIAGIVTAIVWDGPGRDHTVEYRVINEGGGEAGNTGDPVVLVREDGWDGPRFFPFFPLIIIGGVLVTVALIGRGRHGGGGPRGRFEEWHRAAHEGPPPSAPPASS